MSQTLELDVFGRHRGPEARARDDRVLRVAWPKAAEGQRDGLRGLKSEIDALRGRLGVGVLTACGVGAAFGVVARPTNGAVDTLARLRQ